MSDRLPARIVEAIDEFQRAAVWHGGHGFPEDGEVEDFNRARAALDAVILRHLKGGSTPLIGTAPAMLGALQCVVAAMDDMGLQQLDRLDSCPVLRDALSDLVSTAEGRPKLRAVQ